VHELVCRGYQRIWKVHESIIIERIRRVHLRMTGAPAAQVNRVDHLRGLRAATQHNTTCEDGRLPTIVRCNIIPALVDINTTLPGTLSPGLAVLLGVSLGQGR
jgi:hypothetical protein